MFRSKRASDTADEYILNGGIYISYLLKSKCTSCISSDISTSTVALGRVYSIKTDRREASEKIRKTKFSGDFRNSTQHTISMEKNQEQKNETMYTAWVQIRDHNRSITVLLSQMSMIEVRIK